MLYPNTWFLLVPSVTCFQARKLHCDHCCLAGSHLGPLDKPSCTMSAYSISKRWAISSAMAIYMRSFVHMFLHVFFATYFLDPTVCHFHAWILCPGKELKCYVWTVWINNYNSNDMIITIWGCCPTYICIYICVCILYTYKEIVVARLSLQYMFHSFTRRLIVNSFLVFGCLYNSAYIYICIYIWANIISMFAVYLIINCCQVSCVPVWWDIEPPIRWWAIIHLFHLSSGKHPKKYGKIHHAINGFLSTISILWVIFQFANC